MSSPRTATLLVCVLVCLLVSSSIVVCGVRSNLAMRRQVQRQHQLRQTELLLQAGMIRALKQSQNDDLESESWRPSEAIGRFEHPVVEIRVTDRDSTRQIEVVASLGSDPDRQPVMVASRTRRSHSFQIPRVENDNAE